MEPLTIGLLTAGLGAAGSIGSGFLAGRGSKQKESKIQRKQRHLVDQLIASLGGQGPYSDLFKTDEAAFQKSFVDPAKSIFKNQIAPQIQQEYIAGGQQRNSGMEDQLLRAGVDLDQLLNQNFLQFQNQGKDRMQNTLNSILGQGPGASPGMGSQQALQSAGAGYLSSPEFSDAISGIFKKPGQTQQPMGSPQSSFQPPRKGFEQDFRQWNNAPLGDQRWG